MNVIEHVTGNTLNERLHILQRACRRVIATEATLTAEQRLALLVSLDEELEAAGL